MHDEASEGDEVESGEDAGQPLVVLGEAPEAGGPSEAALDHPAARQQHEAALGLGVLDDDEADAVTLGLGRRRVTGVALVDISELDTLARGGLDRSGKPLDLGAVLFVGGRDVEGQEMPQGATAAWSLAPFFRLAPSQPARWPLSGVAWSVRLSRMAAVGRFLRPATSRSTRRRSCTIASKTPACSQRIACW